MNRFDFPSDSLESLRAGLLQQAPREAAAFLLAGHAVDGDSLRLLVREVVPVPADAYTSQGTLHLEVNPVFLAPLIKRARNAALALIQVHTHPFAVDPEFSETDDRGERRLFPVFFQRISAPAHGSLVLGTTGLAARMWRNTSRPEPVSTVRSVGPMLGFLGEDKPVGGPLAEFDRSVRALGADGQASLGRLRVGIVGVGGLGSLVAEQLAHLGVRRFVLIDFDTVDLSNLNRLIGARRVDVGSPKVDVVGAHISRVSPSAEIEAVRGSVVIERDARRLLSCDFAFGCTDTHGSRAVLNQLVYQYYLPTIDMGVRIEVEGRRVGAITGRVQMLAPSLPCLVCQGLLDPNQVRADLLSPDERRADPYIPNVREPAPAVVSINGMVASTGVTMMLSAVAGLPVAARHQILRIEQGSMRPVAAAAHPECVVCSTAGCLGRGDTWPVGWRRDERTHPT